MNSPLSNRLQRSRERLFVGRQAQLDPFARALELETWPRAVWHLHGLGGIGKTTLLRQWKRQAQDAGALVVSLDGRDFEPNAAAFCAALRAALLENIDAPIASPATPQTLCEAMAGVPSRVVLQIDTIELLAPLDYFWREKFLPVLPENAILMLAGRDELPLAWRGDAALWNEVESFNLSALSPLESQNYLAKRGIEAPFWAQLLSWTHGHPLSLSLAADVWQQHAATLSAAPNSGAAPNSNAAPQPNDTAPNGFTTQEASAKPGAFVFDAATASAATASAGDEASETAGTAARRESGAPPEANAFAALDASAQNGAVQNGAVQNGAVQNGAVQNGAAARPDAGFGAEVGEMARYGGAAPLPADLPELVGPLLEHLMREVPTPAHRAALEACAIVRALTQELLAEMLADLPGIGKGAPDFGAIFEWLRGLSMVQSQRYGVFPHDIARELLVADLRFRTPDWHVELHRRARENYLRHIGNESGAGQERAIMGCIYLHRLSPVVAPFLRWNDSGLRLENARPDDFPALLAMVERHEGEASRDIARAHFEAQPEGAIVVREPDGQVQGFVFQCALERAGGAVLALDEGARRAREWLQGHAPLRAGEVATLFRFWMDRDAYQGVGATQSLIFVQAVRHYMTMPHLAFTFFACAQPEFWQDGFAYADSPRLPEADFCSGEQPFGVFGHDWRARPVGSWLELLSQREMQTVAPSPEAEPVAPKEDFRVLDEAEWLAATHDALRSGGDLAGLRSNPLLETALVHRRARQTRAPKNGAAGAPPSPEERALALRSLLREAVRDLSQAPRGSKAHRALELCFGRAALTQEAAAQAMDVSHSSLRRYLSEGVARVAAWLSERDQSPAGAGATAAAGDFSGGSLF